MLEATAGDYIAAVAPASTLLDASSRLGVVSVNQEDALTLRCDDTNGVRFLVVDAW